MKYHSLQENKVLNELKTSKNGLDYATINNRIKKYGLNILPEKKQISPFSIFLKQFKSALVLILIAAAIISMLIGELLDALIIFIILILNALLGFIQEYKAEKGIQALKKLTSSKVKVLRNGEQSIIESKYLVPGDITILESGLNIPADMRLIELYELEINESTLTGESTLIKKKLGRLPSKTAIADQKNMVFSGTTVSNGRGMGVVTATASSTELGKISDMIEQCEDAPTPLQLQLKKLGRLLGILTIIIAFIVFLGGIFKGFSFGTILITSIAIAVAAIPEGLPAIVTIGLALGAQRMIKHKVLIRNLPSVETLGDTSVICADKTGTLTKNQMEVERLFVDNQIITINNKKFSSTPRDLDTLLKIGAACNNAVFQRNELIGDPTEGALITSAAIKGINSKNNQRIGEIPFSSERKCMSTIHRLENNKVIYMKGATSVVLNKCTKIIINGHITNLDNPTRKKILLQDANFSKDALRVLGFAYGIVKEKPKEENLIFVGLQGMHDPPRNEVKKSLAICKKAGIKVIMITGDHQNTAIAIGKELGLSGGVMTGEELDNTTDLSRVVDNITIFARVNPSHKLKIVDALKSKNYVVAMTGDGVNDAPALKEADIGIAMGLSGTDVAKDASDMILLDDNFSSIVSAVSEGRSIYHNIVSFVGYLLSSNIGEVLTLFIGILLAIPLPLLAIQILWINLITDGLPALALSVNPADHAYMTKKPRSKDSKIIPRARFIKMLLIGAIMAGGTLSLFIFGLNTNSWTPGSVDNRYVYALTISFTALVVYQLFNVLNYASEPRSLFNRNSFKNKWLWLAIASSLSLQILVIYSPLSSYFMVTPLSLGMWALIILASSSVLWFGELCKKFFPES